MTPFLLEKTENLLQKKKKGGKKKERNKLPGQYVGGRIQPLIWQVYVSTSSQTYL